MTRDERLDRETAGRINELSKQFFKSGEVKPADIFLSKVVVNSLPSQKVILTTYDLQDILLNYPFAPQIYVTICPNCSCVRNPLDLSAHVSQFLHNLYPYINPDFDLITELSTALKRQNATLVTQIEDLSWAVRDARTVQAFRARSLIPKDVLPSLLKDAAKAHQELSQKQLTELNRALSLDLELKLPKGIAINKYIDVVSPYRAELGEVLDSILQDSTVDGQVSAALLSAKVGELNSELASLANKKRFLLYRAGVAFTKANSPLIASGMLASMMGYTGHLFGCGVAVAGGLGFEWAKRKTKVKLPKEVHRLGQEVTHTMRPHVNRLLAKYLKLDIRAVQLWDIRHRIKGHR